MILKVFYVILVSSVLPSCVVTCKQQHKDPTTTDPAPGKVEVTTENPPIQLDTLAVKPDTSKAKNEIMETRNFHLPVSDTMAVH